MPAELDLQAVIGLDQLHYQLRRHSSPQWDNMQHDSLFVQERVEKEFQSRGMDIFDVYIL